MKAYHRQALCRQFCRTGAKLNFSIFRTGAWRVPSTHCSKSTGAFAPVAPVPTEGLIWLLTIIKVISEISKLLEEEGVKSDTEMFC